MSQFEIGDVVRFALTSGAEYEIEGTDDLVEDGDEFTVREVVENADPFDDSIVRVHLVNDEGDDVYHVEEWDLELA